MSVRIVPLMVLSLMLCGVALAPASHAGEGKGDHKGGPAAFILKHADDLSLTADQKTKLEELAKTPPPPPADKPAAGEKPDHKGGGPMMEKIKEILTPEQMDKLKALREKDKGGKPKPSAPPAN